VSHYSYSHYSHDEILVGVVRELRAKNVPLGIRDYLDVLVALRLGFGGMTKQGLRTLCQRLWARSASEARAIDMVLGLVPDADASDQETVDLDFLLFPGDRAAPRPARAPSTLQGAESANDQADGPVAPAAQEEASRARIYFEGASAKGAGLALPRPVLKEVGEHYVFRPQTPASPRELAVAWRRLRKMGRTGAKRELDVHGTIGAKCHDGAIVQPVLRQSRRNAARLSILFDASPSMAPWRPFAQVLAESLNLAKLTSSEMRYFSNVPRKWIFGSPQLDGRLALDQWATHRSGSALLVVSDAGAARGHFSGERVEQTQRFLARAAEHFRPIVWINPMPLRRWADTTAGTLACSPSIAFLPLDRESLIRAVDVLRGARLP
jgi:hypothetical protein